MFDILPFRDFLSGVGKDADELFLPTVFIVEVVKVVHLIQGFKKS